MPYNTEIHQLNVARKLELAVEAVLERSLGDELPVHVSFREETKARPYVVIHAQDGVPAFSTDATERMRLEIKLKSDVDKKSPDGSSIDHDNCEGMLFGLLMPENPRDLVSELNLAGIAEFYCSVFRIAGYPTRTVEDRSFVSTVLFDVICCGNTIGE